MTAGIEAVLRQLHRGENDLEKELLVIGERQSNGFVSAQQQNYGPHFQAINSRLRALGLRTYTPEEIRKQIAQAEKEAIVITRHGKPAGVLVGFTSEEDWFDYQLEHDPRFLKRIAQARESLRAGKGVKIEDLHAKPKAIPRRTKRGA